MTRYERITMQPTIEDLAKSRTLRVTYSGVYKCLNDTGIMFESKEEVSDDVYNKAIEAEIEWLNSECEWK